VTGRLTVLSFDILREYASGLHSSKRPSRFSSARVRDEPVLNNPGGPHKKSLPPLFVTFLSFLISLRFTSIAENICKGLVKIAQAARINRQLPTPLPLVRLYWILNTGRKSFKPHQGFS
jgi:hypothetical protein